MTNALVAVHHTSLGGVYLSNNIDFTNLASQPTWAKYATTGLANTLIKRAQFDQFDPYNKVYVQLDNDTCYRWNGTSWTEIMTLAGARTAAGMAGGYMGYIFVDKATAGTVYIPMSQDAVGATLLKSVDYGANWTIGSSIVGLVTAVAYGQAAGQFMAISAGEVYRKIYFSTDGGASWAKNSIWVNTFGGGQIKLDPHNPTHVYYRRSASDDDLTDYTSGTATELQNNYHLAEVDHETNHWIDKNTAGHQKIIRGFNNEVQLFATTDNWATLVNSSPTVLDSGTTYYGAIHCAIENVTYGMVGRIANTGGGVQIVQAFVGDNPASMTGISGTNYATPPYTNAIPGAADCYVANCGIYVGVGAGAAETGVFVYADEEGDITDIPSYPNLGVPMFGDRASFRDLDADTDGLTVPTELSKYHAQDIRAGTPQRHNIWPVTNGNIEVSDGTKWVETTPAAFGIHAAVTLAADADTLLGLTGQQLTLDSENANTVLAGPTSGAAADPAFRALVAADLPLSSINLNDLGDVDTTGVANGDKLTYDSLTSTWKPGVSINLPYGSFSSNANQGIANATTAYAITYTDNEATNQVSLSNNSRINIAVAGTYLITFSAVGKSGVANKYLDIWLAVNGTNVPRSNTHSKFVGSANERIITVTYIYDFTAGQYFELYMHSDDTNTILAATAAGINPTRPASPSIIVTVNKVSDTNPSDFLLLETGDKLLLETGDKLLME